MEVGMRLRCCQLPPNTSKPPVPTTAISAGRSWRRLCSSSHHLAVLPGRRPLPRRAGALRVADDDSRPLETACANNIGQSTKLLMREDKFYLVEMEVRDSELDQYGFVSSAVYADYIENAREEVASRLGIGRDSIARTGNAMALSELNLRYFTPLKRGARFVVMVRVVQIKGVRMVVEHFVETLPERKLVMEATATVVFLNKDYRPTRMFPEVASKMRLHFL